MAHTARVRGDQHTPGFDATGGTVVATSHALVVLTDIPLWVVGPHGCGVTPEGGACERRCKQHDAQQPARVCRNDEVHGSSFVSRDGDADPRFGGSGYRGGGGGNGVEVVGGAAGCGVTVALSDGCWTTGSRGVGGVCVAASVGGDTPGRGTTSPGGGGGAGVAPAGPAPSIGGAKQSKKPSEPLFHSPPVARQQSFFAARSLPGSDSRMSERHSSYDPISQLGAAHAVAGSTNALPPSAAVAANRAAGARRPACWGW